MIRRGFTLGEVMLGIGIITVAILTIVVLLVALSQSSSKAVDVQAAYTAADQVVSRVLYDRDNASNGSYWNSTPNPPIDGAWTEDRTEFVYRLEASTVVDEIYGVPLGTSINPTQKNRMKLVTVQLTWRGPAQSRGGYGDHQLVVTRLVREHPVAP